ncbi:MAG: RICIN domain-containing protein, partial [Chromatiales bacterium]
MHFNKYLFAGKSFLATFSIVILAIFAQPGNATESAVDKQVYSLINTSSGQAVNVGGITRTDGDKILQWGYRRGDNQQWQSGRSSSGTHAVVARH